METATIGTPALWIGFTMFVLALLALDLGVFHRRAHEVSVKEALGWSVVWVSLALVFNFGVYAWFGRQRGVEFLTGYLIEKALSVDNLFVFVVIFASFGVPKAFQHRILFWGILGALITRGGFIFAGTALLATFHWTVYFLGALLVITGVKLLLRSQTTPHPEKNFIFRLFVKVVPAVKEYHGQRFLVRKGRIWYATPLLVILVLIETTDILFAVDSIPAVFAVTSDPFIVFTSNIFAILGLRALFFLLAGALESLRYLKFGLSSVLMFVGAKMLVIDIYKVPITVSLAIVAGLLGITAIASLAKNRSDLASRKAAQRVSDVVQRVG